MDESVSQSDRTSLFIHIDILIGSIVFKIWTIIRVSVTAWLIDTSYGYGVKGKTRQNLGKILVQYLQLLINYYKQKYSTFS